MLAATFSLTIFDSMACQASNLAFVSLCKGLVPAEFQFKFMLCGGIVEILSSESPDVRRNSVIARSRHFTNVIWRDYCFSHNILLFIGSNYHV